MRFVLGLVFVSASLPSKEVVQVFTLKLGVSQKLEANEFCFNGEETVLLLNMKCGKHDDEPFSG